ncbi:Dolichyl-phosphate beta-D-mannosyltransferase [Fasciola hepatica]|uniref:Dolichyl-phosphate beta-glucosyltransferase n=1 Tax=Fasciola hepatica TaxID=6192 RepID=A0A4E0RTC2_FASHE|nr:Dolichyl-phosphate beta-D-mannosyltransferase [Fasciola hepatica]
MALELWLLSVVSVITTVVIVTFILLIFIYLTTDPYPNKQREPVEECYLDPHTSEYIKLPFGLTERPEKQLSIIIPAYNEAERLPKMLNEAVEYLEQRKKNNSKFTYEIIVVDDGSVDHTSETAIKYSAKYGPDCVRVIKLVRNRGKGAAVRFGMLSARGRSLLFADADGATKFSDVEKLEDALSVTIAEHWNGSMSVICGSRAHLEREALVKRHPFRNLLMYGFKMCVWLLCVRGVRDTQCGFKLFSRSAARVLFHNLHVERWAFDVDLLYLAKHFDMQIVEVPVCWQEIGGSKLVPIFSWMQMAKDLLLIRLRYSLGAWKIEPVHI